MGGTLAAPVVFGVVSWGGELCGADHSPSVFAEAARYRDFITDPSPTWAPVTTSPATVTGVRRVGGTLRCSARGFTSAPTRLDVIWRRVSTPIGRAHARGRTYRLKASDGGPQDGVHRPGRNDGGATDVWSAHFRIKR